MYDLGNIEELVTFPSGSSMDSPPGPLSWLLSPDLSPGGAEVSEAIQGFLDSPHYLPVSRKIPVAREQMYRLTATSFFRVAGILPGGAISGQYFSLLPRSSSKLHNDPLRPSTALGSGFDTSIPLGSLQAAGVCRVITAHGGTFWRIMHVLPPQEIDRPFALPQQRPTPATPPCLLPVLQFLEEANITPEFMSSDAGFTFAPSPPSVFFTQPQLDVANCSACIMIADESFDPEVTPPAVAVIIEGIERLPHLNAFIGELIGGIAMVYLRSHFLTPILGDMDCKSVIDLQARKDLSSSRRSDDAPKRPYGLLLQALRQGMGQQPWVRHGEAHPERSRPATKTLPGRGPIPLHLWSRRNWLNFLADTNADPDPLRTADHVRRNLAPRRTFRIPVETLLCEVMGPDSLFWVRSGIPVSNPVGSIAPPVRRAQEYLCQRDEQALRRPESSRHYPPHYWENSCIGILRAVLDKLGSPRHADFRSSLLCLVWDQVPTGRRKGLFCGGAAELCPLCGQSDSLEHVVLQCPCLRNTRLEILREASSPYEYGKFSLAHLPSGCTEPARAYLRAYVKYATNADASALPWDVLSLWLARPQHSSLRQIASDMDFPVSSVKELRYIQKELISLSSKLLLGSRSLWRLRCTMANESVSGFTAMSCSRLSPHLTQSSISEYMSPLSPTSPWMAPPSPLLSGSELSPPLDGTLASQSDYDTAWSPIAPSLSQERVSGGASPSPPSGPRPSIAPSLPVELIVNNAGTPSPDTLESQEVEGLASPSPIRGTPGHLPVPPSRSASGPLDSDGQATPSPSPSSSYCPAPRYPVRRSRTIPGYSEGLQLQSDVSTAGKLPASFERAPILDKKVYRRGKNDYPHSWVQPSYFCPGGGLGFYFEVLPGCTLPAGTRIGVYTGRDNRNLQIEYLEAQKLFAKSNYALAYPPGRYIVDGQNGNTISGPARSNDNFDIHNCFFTYHPHEKWMEIITQAPLLAGLYEALTNYDTPGENPSFWRPHRLSQLPPEAQERCRAYYSKP